MIDSTSLGAAPSEVEGIVHRGVRVTVAVLPQWIVARVVVVGSLALAHLAVSRVHPSVAGVHARVHEGLLGWDAGWYEAIARHGYGALGHGSLRFFPLVPLVTRGVATLPGVNDGAALMAVANLSALIATALLFVLVRREGGERLARRATWLLCLVPPAFTLVMGYAEATLLVFTVGCFLALRPAAGRRPHWYWAAILGFAAGLTRPLGLLVVLAVGVELLRWWRGSSRSEKLGAAVALGAPVAGTVVFLGWSATAFGDFFLPLRVQTRAGHHGGLSDPVRTLVDDARGVFHHHFGTALHVPWVLLVVVLLVVCWYRLPACYGAFATGVVIVAASGTNLDSFERYALSAFPLVIAGAFLDSSEAVERIVLVLAGVGLAGYCLLSFLNLSVP